MKAFFSFLQTCAIAILIPLVLSNWLPLFYQRSYGIESTVTIIWWSFALSGTLFAACLWWALGSWGVNRPWAMMALTFGSAMGLMNYGAALIAVHGLGTGWLAATIGLPSHLFQTVVFVAMVFNFLDIQRLAGRPRPN